MTIVYNAFKKDTVVRTNNIVLTYAVDDMAALLDPSKQNAGAFNNVELVSKASSKEGFDTIMCWDKKDKSDATIYLGKWNDGTVKDFGGAVATNIINNHPMPKKAVVELKEIKIQYFVDRKNGKVRPMDRNADQFSNIELVLPKKGNMKYDTMLCWNVERTDGVICLGRWNDGVVN